jgi:hypothetical protein
MQTPSYVTLLAVTALGTPAIGALVVDPFNAPVGGLLLTDHSGGGSAFALTADAGILGGWRGVELTAGGLSGPSAQTGINLVPSRLAIANGPAVTSITQLTYDANGAGLGDIDLVGAGWNSIHFGIEYGDVASTMTAQLFDGATVAEVIIPLPKAPPASSFYVPFTDFTTVGAGDPFGSLDRIVLTLNLPASADVIMTGFEFDSAPAAVPDSGWPFAMLGLSAFTMAAIRRR